MTHNQGGALAIKDWHGGQLVVLWVGAFLACCIAAMVLYFSVPEGDPPWIVWIVLAAILATPIVLLVITWKWFAGKRQRD